MALRLWPSFALMVMLSSLLIMAGAALFIIPGIWVMIHLVFAEYVLVLRGLAPIEAMRESFKLSTGNFWRIFSCILGVLAPLWLIDGLSMMLVPEPSALVQLALDSANGFLQLFSTVVMFRLYMLVSEPVAEPPVS
ncbi:hypothetical protein D3C80_1055390 [compost metagenome]